MECDTLRNTKATLHFKPPDFSDAGNATRFAEINFGKLDYCEAAGWLRWNGALWECGDHLATAAAMDFSKRQLKEALDAYGEAARTGDETAEKAAKSYLKHSQYTRSAGGIERMLKLARPALHHSLDEYDRDPFDLNTPAGIVDLHTGQLRPHDPAARCTKVTGCSPSSDPEAAELWRKFLEQITCKDDSLAGFLQLTAGMALIGKVFHEGAIFAYGDGRNGKSTYFNLLSSVIGTYAGNVDVSVLLADKGVNKGAQRAVLRGLRLAVAGELDEGKRLSSSAVKQICSTDPLMAEEKYKAPAPFVPTHTMVIYTNYLPKIGSTDEGTWRRVILVPFKAHFKGGAVVENYADELFKKAGGAALSWAIEGAQNYIRNGFRLDEPDVVREAIETYREAENWLQAFIDARCICEAGASIGGQSLYLIYRRWCDETGEFPRRNNDFAAELESAGFHKITHDGRRFWTGIRQDYTGGQESECDA